MSTLALSSTHASADRRASAVLRYADLVLLAAALPIFVLAELPLLGYAVAAAGWLVQHAVRTRAERRAREAIAQGDRRSALGAVGISTVGRLWIVTAPILAVGLIAEREDGLAAAVLAAVLVTVHLGAVALERLLSSESSRA